uniref:Uncharacterized protein n=1 Tax=Magallana gigas TaxID=29159 RepID=A0A8W8ICZ7_MAGGI
MALNFRIQDSFPTLNKSCHNKRGTRNRKHVVQVYTPPEDGADPTRGDDNTGALFDRVCFSSRRESFGGHLCLQVGPFVALESAPIVRGGTCHLEDKNHTVPFCSCPVNAVGMYMIMMVNMGESYDRC